MTTATVRRLVGTVDLAVLLRRLRGRHRLVALVGDWEDGRWLVACDPVELLAADADPFEVGGAGWWLGWWGYGLGERLEDVGPRPPRPVPLPDADLARYDTVLRLEGDVWWFESVAPPDQADRRWRDLQDALAGPAPQPTTYRLGPFSSTPTAAGHQEAVRRTLDHIAAGDIFQANVCLRLEATFAGDPLELFLAGVAALHPAYGAFVAADAGAVVSLSPELYLRRRGPHVTSAPIKGTAPAGTTPGELAGSAKDRAENVMIVDLVRNDLGRVARTGTVRVEATAEPRPHTGVMHLMSEVSALLREDAGTAELLCATFPPGSITGAPKIRAMQVIGEVEATAREVYTGAIGVVAGDALELNVAIRTFEVAGGRVWLGVGGGVVTDSDPAAELAECVTKAAPLLRAVGAEVPAALAAADAGTSRTVPDVPRTRARTADPAAGIFDTLLVRDGVPVALEAHVARLVDGVRRTYGTAIDDATLRERVRDAARGLVGRHRLRITYDPAAGSVAIVTAPARDVPAHGWTLVPAVVADGLGEVKWNDRSLLASLPGGPWDDSRDPLLVDGTGAVLETGRGNVLAVFDDGVRTPPLDGRILPGVTRGLVLARLRGLGIPVHEGRLPLADLAHASEVLVTNAIGGVRPVSAIEGVGVPYRPGHRPGGGTTVAGRQRPRAGGTAAYGEGPDARQPRLVRLQPGAVRP